MIKTNDQKNMSSNYLIISVCGETSVANESSNYSTLDTRTDTPFEVLEIYENSAQVNSKAYAEFFSGLF